VCPDKDMQFDICYPPTVPCMLDKINSCEAILMPIFEVDADTVYAFDQVTFTDSSTGDPTSWEWIFEGGTPGTSMEQNPVVTYKAMGVFDVTLTISDGVNPARDIVKLSFRSSSGIADISIYNCRGMEVIQDQIILQSTSNKQYDLSTLPEGIYMIAVRTDNTIQTCKLIIN